MPKMNEMLHYVPLNKMLLHYVPLKMLLNV